MNRSHTKEVGFTIIEMIVSIGIFTVVAVAAVTALTSVIEANRRTQSLTETNNNLNFVLQSMVREIRNGFNYGCSVSDPSDVSECSGGSDEFGFINSAREEAGFRYDAGNERIVDEDGNPITPNQVAITHLQFRVVGSNSNNEQSRVEITIQAEAGTGDTQQTLNLQTTATQRLLYTPN
jgi:type II secretory pathway pseudopilin PulG